MPPIHLRFSNNFSNESPPDLTQNNSSGFDLPNQDFLSSYHDSSNQNPVYTKPVSNKSLDPVLLLKKTLKKTRDLDCKNESSLGCSVLLDEMSHLIPIVAGQLKPEQKNIFHDRLSQLRLFGPELGNQTFLKGPVATDGGATVAVILLILWLSGCDSEVETPQIYIQSQPQYDSGHTEIPDATNNTTDTPSDILTWNDLNQEDTHQDPDVPVVKEVYQDDVPPEVTVADLPPKCPSIETACDGLDEDCDGVTDNLPDINKPCQIMASDCLLIGLNKCFPEKGPALTCEIPQLDETMCNGKDDDCDGKIDDGFNIGDPCSAGIGACNNNGTLVCAPNQTSTVCNATPLNPAQTTETLCNGIDDDCDGTIDLTSNGSPLTRSFGDYNLGECHTGTEICQDKNWTILVDKADPQTETCDGLDNDCNGKIDQNPDGTPLTRPYGEYSLGECHTGTEICSDKNWIILNDKADPKKEICDGTDNDCDGKTDNGFNVGDSCMKGVGVCENSGEFLCAPDHSSTICNATPLNPIETVETLCNGLDDDCDGTIDQNTDGSPLTQLFGDYKQGECKQGINICTDSNWVTSVNKIDPTTEICDGLDNDCDGLIDNNTLDSDGDGLCDTLDNCPTVANPDQEVGDSPNGLACTPKCHIEATPINLHTGDLIQIPFQIKAGETLTCGENNYSLDPNSNSYDLTAGPYTETGSQILDCKITGYNKTNECPPVTINVTNETPQIDTLTVTQKQTQTPNVLTPDNFIINWTASDADGASDIKTYDVNITRKDNQGNPVVVTNCTGLTGNTLSAGDLLTDKCTPTPVGYGEILSPFKLGANQDYNALVTVHDKSNTTKSASSDFSLNDAGLVGRWRFEENLKDESGNNRNGIFFNDSDDNLTNNFVDTGNVLMSSALLLDKTQKQYVTINNQYSLGSGDFTLSAWIHPDTIGTPQAIMESVRSATGYEFAIQNDGLLNFYNPTCGGQISSNTLKAGQWQHVVAIRKDGQIKLYMNGKLESVASCAVNLYSEGQLTFGCNTNDQFTPNQICQEPFNGQMDEIAVYNRALSEDEISNQCHAHDPTGTTCLK